jgi:hypothetical protein
MPQGPIPPGVFDPTLPAEVTKSITFLQAVKTDPPVPYFHDAAEIIKTLWATRDSLINQVYELKSHLAIYQIALKEAEQKVAAIPLGEGENELLFAWGSTYINEVVAPFNHNGGWKVRSRITGKVYEADSLRGALKAAKGADDEIPF